MHAANEFRQLFEGFRGGPVSASLIRTRSAIALRIPAILSIVQFDRVLERVFGEAGYFGWTFLGGNS